MGTLLIMYLPTYCIIVKPIFIKCGSRHINNKYFWHPPKVMFKEEGGVITNVEQKKMHLNI